MTTLNELIAANKITASAEYEGDHQETYENSYGGKSIVVQDDWKVTLHFGRRRMTVDYHMGSGHNGAEPTVNDVLDNLLSDASGVDNAQDFADWASEYGYDEDSRKAEQMYKACQREAAKVRRFLGEHYQVFIEAERD